MSEKNVTISPAVPGDSTQHGTVKDEGVADPRLSHDEEGLKPDLTQAQGDYSGARAKTDKKEIALVKKLDRRILPTICCMYFLNYVCVDPTFVS